MFKNLTRTLKYRTSLKVPHPTHWARVIMNIRCAELIKELDYTKMKTLEISGDNWKNFGFGSYNNKAYPAFDITKEVTQEKYDLIIAEQVFEHLKYPYRAAKNIYEMLNPGGYFLVSTPFLIKIHDCPIDCSRWTPLGMKYFLEEAGFTFENIFSEGWGNRKCVNANYKKWVNFNNILHPLRNEHDFPIHVWALAKK